MARPEERTEAATPRRRQEARREGLQIQAPEVSRALGVAGLAVVGAYFAAAGSGVAHLLVSNLRAAALVAPPTVGWASTRLHGVLLQTFSLLALPMGLAIALAAAGGAIVNGLRGQPLKLNFARLDPSKGFTRIFSRRSLFELPLSVVKIAAFLAVGGTIWYGAVREVLRALLPLQASVGLMGAGATTMGFALAGVAVLIAAGDYLFGRSQFERDVKMTRQELKEELRKTEGDPLVKVRIRSLMRRRAHMRMMGAVKTSDVVVTNPTHYAVALRYDPLRMAAPEVTAKGMGFIAERIKEEARKAGVPILPNAPLAQALHRSVEIGRPIPPELFQAVAEVLAHIYRQQGRMPSGGVMP